MELSLLDFGGMFDFDAFFAAVQPHGVTGMHRRGEVITLLGSPDPVAVASAVAAHTGAPQAQARLEALAKRWDGDASSVDWLSAAHVRTRPVASITFALDATIEQIDWIDRNAAVEVPGSYGERFTGPLLLREQRTQVEGIAGPVERTYSFTAYRTDDSVYQSWDVTHAYTPAEQQEHAQARVMRCIQRITGWIVAAFGGNVAGAQAWIAANGEAMSLFSGPSRDPSGLLLALSLDVTPQFTTTCQALGIDTITDLPGNTELREALISVLSHWTPS